MDLFLQGLQQAFLAGTSLLCFNATAPLYWTKGATHDDKALRLVSGTPSSGGSVGFATALGRTATDDDTINAAKAPGQIATAAGRASGDAGTNSTSLRANTGVGSQSNLGVTGNGGDGPHAHGIELRVHYVDAITINKD